MARVRYIVDNVEEAVTFYTSKLGFEIDKNFAPAIAILVHGDLTLLVSGPKASASRPMLDGTTPSPGGGWNRILLDFDDLESVVSKIRSTLYSASCPATVFFVGPDCGGCGETSHYLSTAAPESQLRHDICYDGVTGACRVNTSPGSDQNRLI